MSPCRLNNRESAVCVIERMNQLRGGAYALVAMSLMELRRKLSMDEGRLKEIKFQRVMRGFLRNCDGIRGKLSKIFALN